MYAPNVKSSLHSYEISTFSSSLTVCVARSIKFCCTAVTFHYRAINRNSLKVRDRSYKCANYFDVVTFFAFDKSTNFSICILPLEITSSINQRVVQISGNSRALFALMVFSFDAQIFAFAQFSGVLSGLPFSFGAQRTATSTSMLWHRSCRGGTFRAHSKKRKGAVTLQSMPPQITVIPERRHCARSRSTTDGSRIKAGEINEITVACFHRATTARRERGSANSRDLSV